MPSHYKKRKSVKRVKKFGDRQGKKLIREMFGGCMKDKQSQIPEAHWSWKSN